MIRMSPVPASQVSPRAQELLNGVKAKLGMTPNMMTTMAHSAAVLDGYLALSGALGRGLLPPALREQIALTVGQSNRCEYCLAAHSALGKMLGLGAEEMMANRRATSADAKTGAALRFVQEVVLHKGLVEDASYEAVRAAGWSEGEVAEMVAHVALNVFTNYFNQLAGTEVDFPRIELAA